MIRRAVVVVALVAGALLPASAQAWTVTVHVHGAGKVVETTSAALMDCTTASYTAETEVTNCVAGSASGPYSSGWIVALQAQVPATYYDRGWRFQKWVDSNAGGGQINCDPQDQAGDYTGTTCQFQIFENLQTDLYFDDTFGPNNTSIGSHPSSATKSSVATFGFDASDDPDARYDCRLDRPNLTGGWVACGSPLDKAESYSGLTTNGTYTFYVRGRDPSGNVDTTPASYSWVVDTVAPTVTISGTPADASSTDNPAGNITAATNEGTLSCTLDGASASCTGGQSGLGPGSHTFAASATDAAGNTGSATRTWTVVAPETSLTGGPAPGSIGGASASFGFTGGTAFECSLDGAAFATCSSPQSFVLAGGSHTFSVRAVNGPNTDPSPATVTWIVDADGDGSIVPQDCNDNDSSTHPGATDTPGDGKDQDCSGSDATPAPPPANQSSDGSSQTQTPTQMPTPPGVAPETNPLAPTPVGPSLAIATITAKWKPARSFSTLTKLLVRGLAPEASVLVGCKGKGCPFKAKRAKPTAAGSVDVAKLLRRAHLRPGAVLTVSVTGAGMAPRTFTYKVRKAKAPRFSQK